MNKKYWVTWIKAALIRAVKTFCQVLATLIGTDLVGFLDLDWLHMLSVAGVSAILSIVMSFAGLPEVKVPPIEED